MFSLKSEYTGGPYDDGKYLSTYWTKYFSTMLAAMLYAEKEYKKYGGCPITWKSTKERAVSETNDISYTIQKVKVVK
jgi:peptide methionine sulfoxide reductase MsrB